MAHHSQVVRPYLIPAPNLALESPAIQLIVDSRLSSGGGCRERSGDEAVCTHEDTLLLEESARRPLDMFSLFTFHSAMCAHVCTSRA